MRSTLRPLALAAFAAVVLASGAARADARTEARRHFKTGMQLIQNKQYKQGIAELEKANELMPHPNVVFNIAQAHAEAGELEEAVAAYKEYLESDPPDKGEVQRIVGELEAKIAAQKAPAPPPPPPNPPPSETKETPKETPQPKPGETKPEVQLPPSKPSIPANTTAKPPAAANASDTSQIVGAAKTEDVYQETIVTASRGAQSPLDAPSSTTIITRQDIHLSGITRIPELLRRVAGMDVMEITGGDENVSMRGFNSRLSNKLLVLLNGRSLYNDILGSTFWEWFSIDVDQIERIEIVRGPGSALYGADAFSGVVNIIPIAPGDGKPGVRVGAGDHGQAYGSVWASGRDGDFAYHASAGFTRYPRWTREIGDDRRDLNVADFDQNLGALNERVDLRTSQRLGKNAEVDVGGGFAHANLDVYGIGPFNDYNVVGDNGDVTVDFKSKYFNARTYFTRIAATSESDYAYLGHTLFPSHPEQNSFDAQGEFVDTFDAGVPQDIHIGLEYRLKNVKWEYLRPDTPIEHHASVYLQDSLHFGKRVTFVGSGRLDYVPYEKRLIPSPRGALIVKPTNKQAIRLSGASAFRSPTFLEAYLQLPVQLVLPGAEIQTSSRREDDPSFILQPEQIIQAELSYLNQESDYFELELNAYYSRVTDLVELAVNRNLTLSNTLAGLGGLDTSTGQYTVAFGGWSNQCDTIHVGGGELGVRVYPTEGLDLFANYALNYEAQQKPSGCDVPKDERTSKHKVNAGVQVRTKLGINGEITFSYQSPQVWNEQVATLQGIVYEQFPLPAYTLLNGRVGYRFYKDRAELSAVVYNALADAFGPPAQQHPFGNQVGRRVMGFVSYSL